jgi:hypothetical protein
VDAEEEKKRRTGEPSSFVPACRTRRLSQTLRTRGRRNIVDMAGTSKRAEDGTVWRQGNGSAERQRSKDRSVGSRAVTS